MSSAPLVPRSRWPLASALAVLAIAGCGSSSQSTGTTESAASTVASKPSGPLIDIPVRVPVLKRAAGIGVIPTRYTCDGADVPPPINWGSLPPGTAEIDLFVSSVENETEYSEWAVAGLGPRVHSLAGGRLPAGALVGRNRSGKVGYSICPRRGKATHYYVLLFPLPHKIPVHQGFNPQSLAERAVRIAPHEGQAYFAYKRR